MLVFVEAAPKRKQAIVSKGRVWRLKDIDARRAFQQRVQGYHRKVGKEMLIRSEWK